MNIIRAKSPRCHGRAVRFGGRRKQCVECKHTWRIRKKRRGRKKKRGNKSKALQYLFHQIPSLYAQSRQRAISENCLKRNLRRSRDLFLRQTPWPLLPCSPPLIVVADAMVQWVNGEWFVFYFILIRKASETTATIAPLWIEKGVENYMGWKNAFDALPAKTNEAIIAIVCDGRVGLVAYAREQRWVVQRCHFHLIARLQASRSKWRLSRHGNEGRVIYRTVHQILYGQNERFISKQLSRLSAMAKMTHSRALRSILSGFVLNYRDYRSYLTHPELRLPSTSNAAESVIGSVRSLCHRARGFRTIASLEKWTYAFLKSKKKFTCNGFHQPK